METWNKLETFFLPKTAAFFPGCLQVGHPRASDFCRVCVSRLGGLAHPTTVV